MRLFARLICISIGAALGWAPTVSAQSPAAVQHKKAPEAKKRAKAATKAVAPEKKKTEQPQALRSSSEARYREGLAHETRGNQQAALMAFLDAGNSGHGQAQKKLGDIYGKGNKAVKRDYDVSLRWYERARAQGIEIPKPHAFTKGR